MGACEGRRIGTSIDFGYLKSGRGGEGEEGFEGIFPIELPFVGSRGLVFLAVGLLLRASAKGSIYRKAACGCAARCVSDVICGCHGDAIDWPTRRQTSRESRRHSDYCPSPAPRPAKPTEGATLPAVLLTLGTTLVRLNVLAHDAICLHVCISSPIHTLAFTHSLTHTHMFA